MGLFQSDSAPFTTLRGKGSASVSIGICSLYHPEGKGQCKCFNQTLLPLPRWVVRAVGVFQSHSAPFTTLRGKDSVSVSIGLCSLYHQFGIVCFKSCIVLQGTCCKTNWLIINLSNVSWCCLVFELKGQQTACLVDIFIQHPFRSQYVFFCILCRGEIKLSLAIDFLLEQLWSRIYCVLPFCVAY